MCGRFTRHHTAIEVAERFEVEPIDEAGEERFNIAPTQLVPVVHHDPQSATGRRLSPFRWGLVPAWADDQSIGSRLINARAETLNIKPSFREAVKRRRCLVPADGFYEWPRIDPPVYLQRQDRGLFAFAGLWEEWKSPDGSVLQSFTIVTVPPNKLIATFHHRMAVILLPGEETIWIDPTTAQADVIKILRPYPLDDLRVYPVSNAVNDIRNDSPMLISPRSEAGIDLQESQGRLF